MKYLPLVWRNLLRRKVRTTFTLGSIFIAFVLYAFLMTIRPNFLRCTAGLMLAGLLTACSGCPRKDAADPDAPAIVQRKASSAPPPTICRTSSPAPTSS